MPLRRQLARGFRLLLRTIQRRVGEWSRNVGAREHVGAIQLSDLTQERGLPGDALGNIKAALALIGELDPRRYTRLQHTVRDIGVAELPVRAMRASATVQSILFDRRFLLTFPTEGIALAILQAAITIRLEQAAPRGGLDTRAQIRRRTRLELHDFASRLPEHERWSRWIDDWLGEAPLGSREQTLRDRELDLRANGVPLWVIRVLRRVWQM